MRRRFAAAPAHVVRRTLRDGFLVESLVDARAPRRETARQIPLPGMRRAAPKRPSRNAFRTVAAYRAAMRTWRAAKKTGRMEVNHRVPCRGEHTTLSCDHHLDNLETLCVACHLERTLTDRKDSAARVVASGAAIPI